MVDRYDARSMPLFLTSSFNLVIEILMVDRLIFAPVGDKLIYVSIS